MQHVNLYQGEFRPRRDPTDALHLALALLVVVVLLLLISGYQAWQAQRAQQRLSQARAQQQAAQTRTDELRTALQQARQSDSGAQTEGEQLRREYAAKQRLLGFLDDGPLAADAGFSGHLQGLAERVVDGVWLERIQLAQGGRRIRLDGHARQPDQIPAFMASLGRAAAYSGRKFRTLRVERGDDGEAVAFVLASDRVATEDGGER